MNHFSSLEEVGIFLVASKPKFLEKKRGLLDSVTA